MLFNSLVEWDITNEGAHLGKIEAIDLVIHFSFDEHCKAFVKPEVAPILARNQIPKPWVHNLMNCHKELRPIPIEHSWWNER